MKLVEWMHIESIQHCNAKAPNDEEELIEVSLTDLFLDFITTGTLGTQPRQLVIEEYYPLTPTFSISIYDEYPQDSSPEKCIHDISVIESVQTYENGTIRRRQSKRERRMSLGEHFRKTQVADECSGSKPDDAETQLEIVKKRNASNLVSKMLNEIPSHPALGRTIDSLHKILHIFNRKVHPENSTFSDQAAHITTEKHEIAKNAKIWPSPEHIKLYSQEAISEESTWSSRDLSHSTQFTKSSGKELWIKTDADYLVLEL